MLKKKMFIGGEWVEALSGEKRSIENPYDASQVAEVSEGGREDAKKAIAEARKAFDGGWGQTGRKERQDLLLKLAELIKRDKEELAELESLNTGKTMEESRWDMDDIYNIFKFYAKLLDNDFTEKVQSPIPDSTSLVVKEPIGVCGQISPWNYPLLQASWKMAPALAAGCTIIMKPSELTPLTTIKVTELAIEAGYPSGVVNLVLGPGHTVGAEMAENHDVDLISFTGGSFTGRKIMNAASGNIKKVALELGGKNPHLIFEDCDFDTAVDYALNGVFFHAGQICSAGTRLMVQKSISGRFIEALKSKMEKIKLGNGFDEGTEMGPVISKEHLSKIESYIEVAKNEGAKLAVGGARPTDEALRKGHFILPTLFTDCDSSMRIVQEEVFGPLITVETFETEEEAVIKANDTIYGLSAGFWTNDSERIERVKKALRFGTVWVNDFNTYFTEAPWGGYKQSGIGRELGHLGLEEYQETKHIFQNHKPAPFNWFGKD